MLNNEPLLASIHGILTWAAGIVSDDARKRAKTNRIKNSIKVSEVRQDGATAEITISVNTLDAPEALAYEFGSGIWGAKGERYPINPKNGNLLAFDWPEAANIGAREGIRNIVTPVNSAGDGGFTGGRAILPGVMHPGVRAEPYMQPALDMNKARITKEAADRSVTVIADMTVQGLQT